MFSFCVSSCHWESLPTEYGTEGSCWRRERRRNTRVGRVQDKPTSQESLLLSCLFLKSGVRLASIQVLKFGFSFSFHHWSHFTAPIPHSCSPIPPNLSSNKHISLSLNTSALFVSRSPSLLSCPAHFNRLLASFLLKLSFTIPLPSAYRDSSS